MSRDWGRMGIRRWLRPRDGRAGFRWGLLLSAFLLAGCGGRESEPPAVVDPPSPSDPEPASGRAGQEHPGGIELPPGEIPSPTSQPAREPAGGLEMPADVPLESSSSGGVESTPAPRVLYATWDEIESAARRSGRVTVVDLWSLACAPCLKEFPELVELHRQLGPQVQCIAVNLDFDGRESRPPESYAERIQSFLNDVGAAGFPAYVSQTPSDDIFTSMNIASLPAIIVYRADGSLAEMFVDAGDGTGLSYQRDVVPLVTQLAGN